MCTTLQRSTSELKLYYDKNGVSTFAFIKKLKEWSLNWKSNRILSNLDDIVFGVIFILKIGNIMI